MVDAKTREEIIYKYLEEGQNIKRLAIEYDVKDVTINKWVKEYLDNFQRIEEVDLFRELNEVQLRYNLIKLHREKSYKEKYLLINHYDIVSIIDSIIKNQETNQFSHCYITMNDKNLLDVYYDIERENLRIMRIFILKNLPIPPSFKIESPFGYTKMNEEQIELFNIKNYPFPNAFDKTVLSNVYRLMDDSSVKKGYIEFNFQEDLVEKVIPKNKWDYRSTVSEKEKRIIRRKVLSSIDSLMNLSFVEIIVSEHNGACHFPRNMQFMSNLLFNEIEWINKSEGTMRIYLSRILREDWAMENYKKLIYEKGVEKVSIQTF